MNETVMIKEGGLTRRLAPVDKLKVNTTDNKESMWVPAERGNTGVLYASENGIYIASEDGYESYSEVVVRVTEESFYGDKDFDHWDYEVPTDFPDLWDSLTLDDFNVDPIAFDDLFNNKDKWDMDIPDLPDNLDFKMKDLKTKKPKKEKITGIDPVSGNEMAVGLDNFGRLTEEILPTSISIITPPSKLVYNNGETIIFSGLVVQAYTADGNVWTDNAHPDGIIPIGELFFPITVAGYTSGSVNIDFPENRDSGSVQINNKDSVRDITKGVSNKHEYADEFDKLEEYFEGSNYMAACITTYTPGKTWFEGWSPYTVTLFRAVNPDQEIILGQYYICDEYQTYGENTEPYQTPKIKKSVFVKGISAILREGTYREKAYLSSYTINARLKYESIESIPVQWYRVGDGQLLETSFEITVKGSGSSDGGGSSQAITYNGTRYVANEDMNAEAHYQSGTVWIRGEAKVWSVPDAVAFGLLKPEEEQDGGSDSGSEHEGGHF